MGEDGLLAANATFAVRARIRVPNATNPIGCGDAMLAGLAVGLKRKLPFMGVCGLGLACGAANAMSKTPGQIRKSDVVRLQSKIEEISI
jgi:fructose-1-phosphate kinase PfkB-like protein